MDVSVSARTAHADEATAELDAVVVGAGFAGLYMLHRLHGLGLEARVLEAGADLGGTWFWNTYPGARCDIESMDYSYSFSEELQQEWVWSERYAAQPEILRYLNHVADRFDLRKDMRFSTRVVSAVFDDLSHRWTVTTDGGETVTARYVISAVGCLSVPQVPRFPGLNDFRGDVLHTGQWPAESPDLTGKRVGLIGTGSSGIQVGPVLQKQVEHLTVFQRTPHYAMPAANRKLDAASVAAWKAEYAQRREVARRSKIGISGFPDATVSAFSVSDDERLRTYEEAWASGSTQLGRTFTDLLTNVDANETAAEFVRRKIRGVVRDGARAEVLTPRDYYFGAKRLCMESGWYAMFNSPDVTLVDVKHDPIVRITENGVQTESAEWEVDTLVFATGYDAITGALLKIDIRGRDGVRLRDAWDGGPRSYLGVMVAGFPNLFTITGPGSPSVLSNVVTSIEQHVEWIAACLAHLESGRIELIEPIVDAQDAWVAGVNELAESSLRMTGNSWYTGANVPGKPQVFMPFPGGVGAYRAICEDVAAEGYRGFVLSAAASAELATAAAGEDR